MSIRSRAALDPATSKALAADPTDVGALSTALGEVATEQGTSASEAQAVSAAVTARAPQLGAAQAVDPATLAALKANPADAAAGAKAVGQISAALGTSVSDSVQLLQSLGRPDVQRDLALVSQYGGVLTAANQAIPADDLAYLSAHGTEVAQAQQDSPGQWQRWWWVCVIAQLLFLPFVRPAASPRTRMTTKPSFRAGRALPARSRRPARPTGDDRAAAILATAERLLGERPLTKISVDDLARGAGISRPTFYFYFRSRDAVLLTLLDRVVAEADAASAAAFATVSAQRPQDPRERWRAMIDAYHSTFRAHRSVTLAAVALRFTNPEARELWVRVSTDWVRACAEAIDAERRRGTAPPGLPSADLSVALNSLNERVLYGTLSGDGPSVSEDDVVDSSSASGSARSTTRTHSPDRLDAGPRAPPGTGQRGVLRERRGRCSGGASRNAISSVVGGSGGGPGSVGGASGRGGRAALSRSSRDRDSAR